MSNPLSVLNYWRNAVTESAIHALEIRPGNAHELSVAEIEAGRTSRKWANDLFVNAQKQRARQEKGATPGNTPAEEAPQPIPLVLALNMLGRAGQAIGRKSGDILCPLYIPAHLWPDGTFTAADEPRPWLPRVHLEPTDDPFILGTLEDFDRYLTTHPLEEGSEWDAILAWAKALFRSITGKNLFAFCPEGYEILEHGYALPCDPGHGMAKYIVRLYDYFLAQGEDVPGPPRLLQTLIAGTTPRKAADAEPLTTDALAKGPSFHVGQMRNDFGLARSQRQATLHILQAPKGSITAVNGPPGTGKTTLLQSVIASLWVGAALKGKEEDPPIILGCSTNNQAVFNILDSFRLDTGSTTLHEQRWLPDLTTYGLSFPSGEMLRRPGFREKYAYAQIGFEDKMKPWPGLPAEMETAAYLEKAETFYLDKARRSFPGYALENVNSAVNRLHTELDAHNQLLQDVLKKTAALELLLRHSNTGLYGTPASEILQCLKRQEKEEGQKLQDAEKIFDKVQSALNREKERQQKAWQEGNPRGWKEKILFFLPGTKAARHNRVLQAYRAQFMPPPAIQQDVDLESLFARHIKTLKNNLEDKRKAWNEARKRKAQQDARHAKIKAALEAWQEVMHTLGHDGFAHTTDVQGLLDRGLRYQMFHLAGRYWEGRWLLELDELLGTGAPLGGQGEDVLCKCFRRWAKITPCMVATFHMAPKIFKCFRGGEIPLVGLIDMLIVDEAGQIAPEIGGVTFALAQRAVVVGDIYQIEPIPSVSKGLDAVNAEELGLKFEQLDKQGAACSTGSIMRLANQATYWTLGDKNGLFLSEHRRCKDAIIAYCNELVYGGQLEPCTHKGNTPNGLTPMMGYAHLTHASMLQGGSHKNPGVAQAVAAWLAKHSESFERTYKKPVAAIVAIITPYRAQAEAIRTALNEHNLATDAQGITVGTVHALQGAQRPIVIFVPTVSYQKNMGAAFYDRNVNMLNVAVSRAEDSFLVFGDMRLFNPSENLPSSILARYLFAHAENEIIDVAPVPRQRNDETLPTRIDTLQQHRDALRQAISHAKKKLLVVSPFLSIRALEDNDLCTLLAATGSRGVEVLIVTSVDLNKTDHGRFNRNFLLARDALEQAGCRVLCTSRVHNKTLAVDDVYLIEGSFNWLSAVRDEESPYSRREASLILKGPEAAAEIAKEWQLYTDGK